MSATSIIAIYAALVATAALGVQFAQWRSARTSLKVQANAGVAPVRSGKQDEFGNETFERREVVFVSLTNKSPHTVKITHVGFLGADGRKKTGALFARPYPLSVQLPFEIPARDVLTLWQPRDGLDAWETGVVRVVVQTAGGDKFQSRRCRLSDLSRLEIVP